MDYSRKISERQWNIPDKGELESRREATYIDDIIQKNHIERKLLEQLDGIRTVFDGGAVYAKDSDDNETYSYTFLKDYVSPYFSVNFSVTKEIGDLASISFYANNFFNNMGQVHSTRTGEWNSVSSYIPRFHYGLTLRLNF